MAEGLFNPGITQADVARIVEDRVQDKDTAGNAVPSYRPRTYTYDDSGNRKTETVSDSTGTWVKTYTYANGVTASDSGWVKQ